MIATPKTTRAKPYGGSYLQRSTQVSAAKLFTAALDEAIEESMTFSFAEMVQRFVGDKAGGSVLLRRGLERAFKRKPKGQCAKMPGMAITKLQALIACDDQSIDAAVKSLMKLSKEDYDLCLAAVDDLLKDDLITFTVKRRESSVSLTPAGHVQLHHERTRVNRGAAYDALDEMGLGD